MSSKQRREGGSSARSNDDRAGATATRGGRTADSVDTAGEPQLHALHRAVGNGTMARLAADRTTESDNEVEATPTRSDAPMVPAQSFEGPLGEGRPLPTAARSTLASMFGHELSGIRLHTRGFGVWAAEAMGVPAFAVGRDIVVRPSDYSPTTRSGRSLLAHEVAHVFQQGRTTGQPALRVDAEREAMAAAAAVGRAPSGRTPETRPALPDVTTAVRVAPQGYTGSHALSPEELFELLKSWRGHTLETGAASIPSEQIAEADRTGAPVEVEDQKLGHGTRTTAILALSDADGEQLIDLATGTYYGDTHAEQKALADLEQSIGRSKGSGRLRNAHLMVVVDKSVCDSCRRKLRAFVKRHDLAGVSAYVFTRKKLRGTGEATPKTSMTGTTKEYSTNPGPLRRKLDFSYANPNVDGGEQPRQQSLLPDQRQRSRPRQQWLFPEYQRAPGEADGRMPYGVRQPKASEWGSQAADAQTESRKRGSAKQGDLFEPWPGPAGRSGGEAVGEPPKQQTLFEYTRKQAKVSGSGLSSPPLHLHPGVRLARLTSTILDVVSVFESAIRYANSLNMAMALASGDVVHLTKVYESLKGDLAKIKQAEANYDRYSQRLGVLEQTLPYIANSGDLEAIQEAAADLYTIQDSIGDRMIQIENNLMPTLQETKRVLIEKRQKVDRSLRNWEDLFLLSLGGSTEPQAELHAYRQDLIKLNAVVSATMSVAERLVEQMKEDREMLDTWIVWMNRSLPQTESEMEDDEPE